MVPGMFERDRLAAAMRRQEWLTEAQQETVHRCRAPDSFAWSTRQWDVLAGWLPRAVSALRVHAPGMLRLLRANWRAGGGAGNRADRFSLLAHRSNQ